MASANGLTSGVQCFSAGDSSTKLWRSADNNNFSGEITVTDSAGDVASLTPDTLTVSNGPTEGAFSVAIPNTLEISTDAASDINIYPGTGIITLGADNTGQNTAQLQVTGSNELILTSYGSMVLVPNASSGNPGGGFTLQDGVTNPPIADLEVYEMVPSLPTAVLRAQTMMPFIAASGPSALTLSVTNIGCITYISGGVPTVNLPAPGTVPNGTEFVLYQAPGNGPIAIQTSTQPAVTVCTVSLINTQVRRIICFTPDQGTSWYVTGVTSSSTIPGG
jgi:hypothetical protein